MALLHYQKAIDQCLAAQPLPPRARVLTLKIHEPAAPQHFSPPSELESILVNRAERAHTSLRKLLTTYGCVPASVLGGKNILTSSHAATRVCCRAHD
mmetsp:Transcript_27048/g.63183  ORF Transcript_27048/g.63183 Transcript_27048/m.63183 type:complete len:97 (-) Transcript_27048:275-565(-)